MQRFLLVPDNEEQKLYLLCTKPLVLFHVRYEGLKVAEGEASPETIEEANIFYSNFSNRSFELKRKKTDE